MHHKRHLTRVEKGASRKGPHSRLNSRDQRGVTCTSPLRREVAYYSTTYQNTNFFEVESVTRRQAQ